MTALDLAAVKARYSAALDAKPSKGPVTRFDLLTDSVADVPELIKEVERLREAVKMLRATTPALNQAAGVAFRERERAEAAEAEVERLCTWKRREEVRVTLLSEAHDRAEATLARVEAVHARYFDTDLQPGRDADANPEPEDVWRYDRDLRAALAGEQPAEPTETVDLLAALRDSLITTQAERKKGEAVRALRSLSTDKPDTEAVHFEADKILLSVAPTEVAEAYEQLIEDIDGFWYA